MTVSAIGRARALAAMVAVAGAAACTSQPSSRGDSAAITDTAAAIVSAPDTAVTNNDTVQPVPDRMPPKKSGGVNQAGGTSKTDPRPRDSAAGPRFHMDSAGHVIRIDKDTTPKIQ